jgi:hypothetical protein
MVARRCELPFSGGFGCQAREILAWTWIFESFADDVAGAVGRYANRNPDMPSDRVADVARNVGNFFVEHDGQPVLRRLCGLI